MDRELLSETFVELTDTMVADFDVIDFLHVLTDRASSSWTCPRQGCCWLIRAARFASWRLR